jgi:hypothetical protein
MADKTTAIRKHPCQQLASKHIDLKQLHMSQILNMASVLKIEDEAWHGLVEPGGEFPPEKGRYHLYIGRRALAQNASEADHLL